MAPLGRYYVLTRHLQATPLHLTAFELSFREIEEILGGPLPRAARRVSYWRRGPVARRNWLAVGFTAELDELPRTVRFTRERPRAR